MSTTANSLPVAIPAVGSGHVEVVGVVALHMSLYLNGVTRYIPQSTIHIICKHVAGHNVNTSANKLNLYNV